jgi:hypothetical protein
MSEVNMKTEESMLYHLTDPDKLVEDTIHGIISWARYEIHECVVCGRRWSGKQLSNLEIELFGTTVKDFVWVDSAVIIVTLKMVDILQRSEILGFDTLEVDVINSKEYSSIGPLFQVIITGSGGRAVDTASAQLIDECKICGWAQYAPPNQILVRKEKWDKSDIFLIEEYPGFPLITQRFRNVLESNSIENYKVEYIAQFI